MDIWVDADACPVAIREIIAKAAHKRAMTATFVANHAFSLLSSPHVRLYQVPSGFDEADKAIEQRVSAGDLVITADIPLAADIIANPHWCSRRAVSATRKTILSSAYRCVILWKQCGHRALILEVLQR